MTSFEGLESGAPRRAAATFVDDLPDSDPVAVAAQARAAGVAICSVALRTDAAGATPPTPRRAPRSPGAPAGALALMVLAAFASLAWFARFV